MTSLQRKFQRKRLGVRKFNELRAERTQAVKTDAKSYTTLHPTKGWLKVSFKRISVKSLFDYLRGIR